MIPALDKLVEALCRLPTIGKKSATRLALFMLEQPQEQVDDLAQRILELKKAVVKCSRCFNYSQDSLCDICRSPGRNQSQICVVEKAMDIVTIERSGTYQGMYHVLGGLLSPIHGITADRLTIAHLQERLADNHVAELIIGLGGSSDAESTALYLCKLFRDFPVPITRLARGVPAGMELEYVDPTTLMQALKERTPIYNPKPKDSDS